MAVNRPDVIGKVNVGTGDNHGDETEEDGICQAALPLAISDYPLIELPSGEGRTEDELFRRREHIYRKGHFILVDLQAEPADEGSDGPDQEIDHGCWALVPACVCV